MRTTDLRPDDAAPGRSSHPVLAPANGSAPALNREQIEILDHTERRAAGGFYCGGGKEMDALVTAGLMEYAGRKSFVPDPYYRITGRGRDALKKAQNDAGELPIPATKREDTDQ